MEELGIATRVEFVPNVVDRMRDEVMVAQGVALSPALVGAWSWEFIRWVIVLLHHPRLR